MYRLHLQYFEIFLKSVKSAHFNEIVYNISKIIKYLFFYKNISESQNCNVAMKDSKYFCHVSAIFCAIWVILYHEVLKFLSN